MSEEHVRFSEPLTSIREITPIPEKIKAKYKKRDNDSIGMLSDKNIVKERKKGLIVIEPFKQENLLECSYTITLGNYYFHMDDERGLLNMSSCEEIRKLWGDICSSETVDDVIGNALGMKEGDQFIFIKAGTTILTHSQEFIGTFEYITSFATSCIPGCIVSVRNSFEIGVVDKYYFQITNITAKDIVIQVGKPIGKIVFFYSNYPSSDDKIHHFVGLNSFWVPDFMFSQSNINMKKGMIELLNDMENIQIPV